MTQEHPITPPAKLLDRWLNEWAANHEVTGPQVEYVATRAARWGADQELKACCEWTAIVGGAEALRAARRPKPPSLKEQALEALDEERADMRIQNYKLVRSVLESLPE